MQTNDKLNLNDTLVVIIPFLQEIPIKDYKTALYIKENLFEKKIQGINYNMYTWFYSEPDTWVKLSKKHKEGIEMTSPTYYQKYFEYPIQKLLNNRVNYFITKIDNSNRMDTVEEELGIIMNKLHDTKVQDMVVSDKMCEQLKFYKKRYFLITDILEYNMDSKEYKLTGHLHYLWYRLLVLDIVSKKVIVYRNAAELCSTARVGGGYVFFSELKHFVKKVKRILPKKNKPEKY